MFPSGRCEPPRLVYVNERPSCIWTHWGTLEGLPLRYTNHIAYAYAMQASLVLLIIEGDAIQCIAIRCENDKKTQRLNEYRDL
jgi:hypothetical protein